MSLRCEIFIIFERKECYILVHTLALSLADAMSASYVQAPLYLIDSIARTLDMAPASGVLVLNTLSKELQLTLLFSLSNNYS
mmetsp:Transcript_14465/g.29203  ORF Transcript_14465/g.29203 Transcript_14465/m.29203 type:complete len:82 (+) Transcript_14465:276-521(+)